MLAPALEPYVASLTEYDVVMPGPGVHRGVPSTTLTLVLPLDDPLDVLAGQLLELDDLASDACLH